MPWNSSITIRLSRAGKFNLGSICLHKNLFSVANFSTMTRSWPTKRCCCIASIYFHLFLCGIRNPVWVLLKVSRACTAAELTGWIMPLDVTEVDAILCGPCHEMKKWYHFDTFLIRSEHFCQKYKIQLDYLVSVVFSKYFWNLILRPKLIFGYCFSSVGANNTIDHNKSHFTQMQC